MLRLRQLAPIVALGIATAVPAGPSSAATAGTTTCQAGPLSPATFMDPRLPDLQKIFEAFPALGRSFGTELSQLCFAERLFGMRAYFEAETGSIVIDGSLQPGLAQAALVHELRHLQQYVIAACPSPGLSMAEHARAVFAMEADASAASLVVAARMRQLGRPAMWQALAEWPMQADIARAFDATLSETGDIAQAASRAFEQWYENDLRRDAYYVAACSDYLDRADKDHRLPAYGTLDTDFFDTLCRLPSGAAYACADPEADH